MANTIGKTIVWTTFLSGYLVLITQIGNLCSWCSNLLYNHASSGIFFVMFKIWFYLKKIWKIKILPHLHWYFCSLFGFQKLFRHIVTGWIIACFQLDLKGATVKYHTKFFRFFYTISDKNYRKNCYLSYSVFLPSSPSSQCWETMSITCVKLCSGLATLYGGTGGILNRRFKIPVMFFTDCLKFIKKTKMRSMHDVWNNSNLL